MVNRKKDSSVNVMHKSIFLLRASFCNAVLLTIVCSVPLFGQTGLSSVATLNPTMQPAAYYNTAKPGEITITVNLWGQILRPGRYEVVSTASLVELISFAGGPQQYANMDEVRVVRIEKVDDKEVVKEYIVDMENIKSPDPFLLRPGDTVIIKPTAWSAIRDAFSVVTTAAVITSAVASVMYYSKH